MIRTQVQLTQKQYEALKKISSAKDVSMAALIRQSVEHLIADHLNESQAEQVERAIKAAGRFRSGLKDLAREHDRHFREAIAE